MESSAASPPSRGSIVNLLTLKLVGVGIFAAVVNWSALIVSGPLGLFRIGLFVLGNVVVCWLVVDAVFAALDQLLESKLHDRA
ncbi:hypothetical protein GS429_14205 [Natronorubrum sp. JWXQ-INN-674]|uniref:Uncharacterized protein n=1 Tax=Natronorubrum halalkaliphilum TaxID=2691917 RepID=A0A6B0VRS4_9EURY|nr:hypothetical protein [Natronorubrum halalkaliphilum]MXV63199.1 hypothetical protein [Natronorubrum halalkaliphilum]